MYTIFIPLFSTYTFMSCYRVSYQTIYYTVSQCLNCIDCRMELIFFFFFPSGMVSNLTFDFGLIATISTLIVTVSLGLLAVHTHK